MSTQKTKREKTYKKPHIGEFIAFIAQTYNLDEADVAVKLTKQFPELKKKETCANCGASMAEYIFTLDILDALLVFGMGKIVGRRAKTMPFNAANRVHIQSELNKYYSVASRTTQCAKLGLIAKVTHRGGIHDRKAGWLITKRGFEFLAGKPVPKHVQTFRNHITDRFEETTTIAEVMKEGRAATSRARDELSSYTSYPLADLESWAVAGFNQGTLL